MNNRAVTTTSFIEWLAHHHPAYEVYGATVRDLVSGDIAAETWDHATHIRLAFDPITQYAAMHLQMANFCIADPHFTLVEAPVVTPDGLLVVFQMAGVAGSESSFYFHSAPNVALSPISVDNLRVNGGHLGVLFPHVDTHRFHDLFWGCVNRTFTLDPLTMTPLHRMLATRLVQEGWTLPPDQLPLLGLAQAPALGHMDVNILPGDVGFAHGLDQMPQPPVQVPTTQPGVAFGTFPGGGPPGVLPEITTPVVPVAILPTVEELQAQQAQQALEQAQHAQEAQNKKMLEQARRNMPKVQQNQSREIERVAGRYEAFLSTHRTPEEKVANAHGQDVEEYAQAGDPATSGFGGTTGWN